jgi:hypothetical protein
MMPARDLYHDQVRRALEADGWQITHDPLRLVWGSRDFYVDLGAERLLAAEKNSRKIAVELKSFLGPSFIADLEQAIGQFVLYQDLLVRLEPERILYLAVEEKTFRDFFEEAVVKMLLENQRLKLLIFRQQTPEVVEWLA